MSVLYLVLGVATVGLAVAMVVAVRSRYQTRSSSEARVESSWAAAQEVQAQICSLPGLKKLPRQPLRDTPRTLEAGSPDAASDPPAAKTHRGSSSLLSGGRAHSFSGLARKTLESHSHSQSKLAKKAVSPPDQTRDAASTDSLPFYSAQQLASQADLTELLR
ncbi:hypothetical protein HDV03_004350 [Kappamyces sp. JEL0829]|nr:hypothetical protein HDV03_004350 [Kappamyces sp. JEL0829]